LRQLKETESRASFARIYRHLRCPTISKTWWEHSTVSRQVFVRLSIVNSPCPPPSGIHKLHSPVVQKGPSWPSKSCKILSQARR
jgi:hypothetical protein